MNVRFNDFQYDCDRGILTKNGRVVALSEKPAQLLSLLIQEADSIHAKADILEKIWPDRVVTEQVVFQNISYLRALFGDDAIRTFSKKGYQWQLSFTEVVQSAESPAAPIEKIKTQANAFTHNQAKSRSLLIWSLCLILCTLIVATLLLWPDVNEPDQELNISSDKGAVYFINGNNTISDEALAVTVNAQNVFDSPYSTWQKHRSNEAKWLVAVKRYWINDKVALRYHIQGAKRGWSDYITATNFKDAQLQLRNLLAMLAATDYFEAPSDHTALAALTLLLAQNPEHEQLNVQHIKQQFTMNELDRANALADRVLSNNPSEFRAGLLYLLKTQINLWNKNNHAANENVNKAIGIFSALKQTSLQARALVERSWVHLADLELRLGMQVLNQAASKARSSGEPLLELTARLNQSFMASKAGEVELSHTQLGLAKELIELHQLGEEHQVRVLNNEVWMAKTIDEMLLLNNQILAMSYSPQYEIYYHIAAESVRDMHIKQQRWQLALATIKHWQRASFQALSKAHIAFAQNEWQSGVANAKEAYRLAQANQHKVDALDAALLLVQRQKQGAASIDVSEYDAFIKQNATNRWREQNYVALQQLSN